MMIMTSADNFHHFLLGPSRGRPLHAESFHRSHKHASLLQAASHHRVFHWNKILQIALLFCYITLLILLEKKLTKLFVYRCRNGLGEKLESNTLRVSHEVRVKCNVYQPDCAMRMPAQHRLHTQPMRKNSTVKN